MKEFIFSFLFKVLSILPLSWLRSLGDFLGWLLFKYGSKRKKRLLYDNLLRTRIATKDSVDIIAKESVQELCKSMIETVAIAWSRSKNYNTKLIINANRSDKVLEAIASGHPILFLTPHIGNFEIMLKHSANIFVRKSTILFKNSKHDWLNNLMLKGRAENNITPIPISKRGILALFKALKNRELAGILPDSVASEGDGVWVKFFDNDIFATTLAAKMVLMPDTKTFIVNSIRIKKGFIIDYIPYVPETTDIKTIVQEVYNIIEQLVKKNPTQYYWLYDRFRKPDHAHSSYIKLKS